MKATIELNIKSFAVQDIVLLDPPEGPSEGTTGRLQLQDLTPETLARLCDEFRDSVFEKAGKPDPSGPLARHPELPGIRPSQRMTGCKDD